METIQPLNKDIYDRAVKLGVKTITLNFSGGHDEGYLDVTVDAEDRNKDVIQLESDVETWAWDVYSYNGAGCGNDYGDDIEYDIAAGTATTSNWYTDRIEGDTTQTKLEIADNE